MRSEIRRDAGISSGVLLGVVTLWGVLVTPLVASGLRVSLPACEVPVSYYWGSEFAQAVRACGERRSSAEC